MEFLIRMQCFTLLALALPLHLDTVLTEDQALASAFPKADRQAKELALFTAEERAQIERVSGTKGVPRSFAYRVLRRGTELQGYAVIDDVPGKSEPITFLLAVDAELRVRSIEVLAYRESRGGEVRQADWRAQFAGKDARAPLRIGSDIRNIAGATISCRSLTDGVRRDLAALAHAVELARASTAPVVPLVIDAGVQPRARMQFVMGTTLSIRCEGAENSAAAFDAAFAEVDRLDRLLSDWKPQSELSRFNAAAGGEPVQLGPELFELVRDASLITRSSEGAFDITVGPLVMLWRRCERLGRVPTADESSQALALSGARHLELDLEQRRARLDGAGAALDLGAIGKGYALERAAAVLEQHGLHSALLDFGGQILALGAPAGQSGWRVAISNPRPSGGVEAEIVLKDESISTSADTERGRTIGGRRYSHIVDPRTGRPVEGLLGAFVVHARAGEADAWSTALFVLGPQRGFALARERGLAALLIDCEGHEQVTDSLRARLLPAEAVGPR